MQSISVSESISKIQKKMDEFKRELLLLEGSLSVYTVLLAQGVKTINVPEIIEIKCECNL